MEIPVSGHSNGKTREVPDVSDCLRFGVDVENSPME